MHPNRRIGRKGARARRLSLRFRAARRARSSTALGSRLKVAGSISASTGVAPARRMALTDAKKLKGVVMTAWRPAPMPAAASASQRASVPEEHPIAWLTPNCAAAVCSKAATCSPRMNCCVSSTWSSASSSSRCRGWYWRFRSSMGTGWAVETLPPVLAVFCTGQWYQRSGGVRPIPLLWEPVVDDCLRWRRVEKVRKRLYCCHIAGFGGSGASGAVPADLSIQTDAAVSIQKPSKREQEIGIWRTSRHKIFRTLS